MRRARGDCFYPQASRNVYDDIPVVSLMRVARAVSAATACAIALAAAGSAGSARGGEGAACSAGAHVLELGSGRTALMRVTPGGRGGKALILALHGAGGGGHSGLHAFRGGWRAPGIVLVAPASKGQTWSFLRGRDTDLPFVNRAIARALTRCAIDRRRIAVGGFSDGATYALTLGLRNGDRFRAVIAFSPGGVLARNAVGKPRVFVSHGTRDGVLPISRTSDVIVRELRRFGYSVTYRRFTGGHTVPARISAEAVRWFLRA